MAQPLDARIASAMGNGARAATVAELIEELGSDIDATQAEHDRLDALSKSATASEKEADAAADAAAKLARKLVRLGAKREQLTTRHAELMNSERRRKAVAAHAEVKARRDDLVQELRREWPELERRMVELLVRISESDAECETMNRDRTYGLEWLDGAEAPARGCPANFYHGAAPIRRLINITLPAFDVSTSREDAWPPRNDVLGKAMEAEHRARVRAKEMRLAEQARWQRYLVEPGKKFGSQVSIQTRHGDKGVWREAAIYVMSPEQVADAKAKGCRVTPAKDNEFVGGPAGVATF